MKKLTLVLTTTLMTTLMATSSYADGRWQEDRNQYRVITELFYPHQTVRLKTELHKEAHKDLRNQLRRDKRQHDYQDQRNNKHHGTSSQTTSQQHSKHSKHRGQRWEPVSAFRGRSGKTVTRSIRVQDKVDALAIQGTKRGMNIQSAHAVMGNGRWVRLRGLEGRVRHGEQLKHRLRHSRHVQKVVINVAPDRYKRGYAELSVKTAR